MRKKGPRVLWVAVLSKYMFPPILPELWWQACFFSPVYSKPILRMWRDLKLNLSPKSPLTWSLSILPHLWDALGKKSTALLWKCLILTDVNWGGPGASPQALRERHLYLPSPPNEYKRPRNLFSYLFNPCALSARGPLRCDHPVHHPRPNGHYPYVRLCSAASTQQSSGEWRQWGQTQTCDLPA